MLFSNIVSFIILYIFYIIFYVIIILRHDIDSAIRKGGKEIVDIHLQLRYLVYHKISKKIKIIWFLIWINSFNLDNLTFIKLQKIHQLFVYFLKAKIVKMDLGKWYVSILMIRLKLILFAVNSIRSYIL